MTRRDAPCLLPDSVVLPAKVTIHHRQLRDLIQLGPDKGKVLYCSTTSILEADFNTQRPSSNFCNLTFVPVCLTTGAGYLAAGGGHSELALRPLDPRSQWLYQTHVGGKINNSICLFQDPLPFAKNLPTAFGAGQGPGSAGFIPGLAWTKARKRWSRSNSASTSGRADNDLPTSISCDHATLSEGSSPEKGVVKGVEKVDEGVEEEDPPNPRILINNNDQTVKLYRAKPSSSSNGDTCLSSQGSLSFSTPINHASMSPDGKYMIAVGDTPEVFLFSVSSSGDFKRIATYTASTDASFSTAFSPCGRKFVVASQDGIVSVWDVRSSKKLAQLRGVQNEPLGSARCCKFSPDGAWLAWTEHKNYFHGKHQPACWRSVHLLTTPISSLPTTRTFCVFPVVDTTTFTDDQVYTVPARPSELSPVTGASTTTTPSGWGGEGGEGGRSGWDIPPRHSLHHPPSTALSLRSSPESHSPPSPIERSGAELFGRITRRRDAMDVRAPSPQGRRRRTVAQDSSSGPGESENAAGLLPGAGAAASTASIGPWRSWVAHPELRGERVEAGADFAGRLREESSMYLPILISDLASGDHDRDTNISGLVWEAEGDYVYVGTETTIARYAMAKRRNSFSYGELI